MLFLVLAVVDGLHLALLGLGVPERQQVALVAALARQLRQHHIELHRLHLANSIHHHASGPPGHQRQEDAAAPEHHQCQYHQRVHLNLHSPNNIVY